MRNLKRVLSLALALVMVLGMMVITTSAADFTDAEEITYTEAVEVMSAIGVINGMGDGTFAPKGTLTREQAAKILAYVTLGAEADNYLTGSAAPFEDVAATKWSAKYVAYCKNLGIIAGVGDNKFNPAGTLTTVQFAKMLLVAVGIDGTYTGAGWENNVKTAAKKAGLDVITIDNSNITREEACEMALAAMKYAPESAGWAVKSGNTVLKTFADEVDAIVYKATMAALEIENLSVAPVAATGYLLDEVYGVTYGDSTDEYGRPGIRYTKAPAINLFYADEAVAKYVNTFNKDVVDAMTKANNDVNAFAGATVKYNGFISPDADTVAELYDNKTPINGMTVELYNLDNNAKTIELVVAIEKNFAVVTDVTLTEGQSAGSVTLKIAAWTNPAGLEVTYTDDLDSTTDTYDALCAYAKGTALIVGLDKNWHLGDALMSVEEATAVEGKITKLTVASTTNSTTVQIGETTYKMNSMFVGGKNLVVGKEGTLYVDANGCAIGWADKAGPQVETVYAYVIDMQSKQDQADLFESQPAAVWYAQVLKTDGTVEVIPTTESGNTKIGRVVTLTAGTGDNAGKTVLALANGWNSTSKFTLVKNTATQNSHVYNNKTIFVVQTTNPTTQKPVYTIYTGVTNIPATVNGYIDSVIDAQTSVVKVCFVTDATVYTAGPAAIENIAYLVGNTNLIKEVVGEDVVAYYTYNAMINGEATTVNVKANYNELTETYSAAVGTGLYGSLTYTDGLVTNAGGISGDGIASVSKTGTAVAKDGVIALGGTNYLYDDATVVYKVANGAVSATTIGALKADANDTVVGYTTNGILTTIVVTVVNP